MKHLRLAIVVALAFAAGILITRKVQDWFGDNGETVVTPTDPAKLEKARVDPTPGLLERVQLGRVKPSQVRIGTAPSSAGKKRVADYCTPVPAGHLVQTAPAQTSANREPIPETSEKAGPPILPDFGGRAGGSKVFLSSTLNDGRPWDATYKVRGRWTFASSGDSVVVRSERFWSRFVRGALRCGAAAGISGGIGALVDREDPLRGAARGAVLVGGSCAALEIVF